MYTREETLGATSEDNGKPNLHTAAREGISEVIYKLMLGFEKPVKQRANRSVPG